LVTGLRTRPESAGGICLARFRVYARGSQWPAAQRIQRKGRINRAILVIRPGDPTPMLAGSVMGTRYSYKERLEHGPAWELKRLGETRDGKTLNHLFAEWQIPDS
jgi:hypothetical protein